MNCKILEHNLYPGKNGEPVNTYKIDLEQGDIWANSHDFRDQPGLLKIGVIAKTYQLPTTEYDGFDDLRPGDRIMIEAIDKDPEKEDKKCTIELIKNNKFKYIVGDIKMEFVKNFNIIMNPSPGLSSADVFGVLQSALNQEGIQILVGDVEPEEIRETDIIILKEPLKEYYTFSGKKDSLGAYKAILPFDYGQHPVGLSIARSTELPGKRKDAQLETEDPVTPGEKYNFINNLLDYTSKHKIGSKSRERLFSLIAKEVEHSGVSEEILKRIESLEARMDDPKMEIQEQFEVSPFAQLSSGRLGNLKSKRVVASNIVRKHRPRDVAEFMSLFNTRDGLKYLTHDYDETTDFDFNTFLESAQKIVKEQKFKRNLPRQLVAIIQQFAFTKSPKWASYNDRYRRKAIKKGWSSPEWGEWSQKNSLHPINNEEFRSVIDDFRKLIRIKPPQLEGIVSSVLKDVFKESLHNCKYSTQDLDKADFYFEMNSFRDALIAIFIEIRDRGPKKKEFSINYGRDYEGEYALRRIIITHMGSYPEKEFEILKNEWTTSKGSMGRIASKLFGYCHWSVETKFDKGAYRVNILKDDETTVTEEMKESDIEGFKHILTYFYK